MTEHIHLVKLCVGAETLDDLINWQQSPRSRGPDGRVRHVTRMWPKKQSALLAGGGLYWVIKGVILARQRVIALDEVIGEDGIRRCAIVLDPDIRRTEPVPRRPFQGWRYLSPDDAPRDLARGRTDEAELPPALSAALADIGVI